MTDTSSLQQAWWTAVWEGNVAAVRELLRRGADPAWRDTRLGHDGSTALIAAGSVGDAELIRVLLDAGADVNARSESGFTALIWACDAGALDAARVLLDAGADPTLRNAAGFTAYRRVPAECRELRALLEERGGAG